MAGLNGGKYFHNVDAYQTITLYTLNISQLCQFSFNKAGEKKPNSLLYLPIL